MQTLRFVHEIMLKVKRLHKKKARANINSLKWGESNSKLLQKANRLFKRGCKDFTRREKVARIINWFCHHCLFQTQFITQRFTPFHPIALSSILGQTHFLVMFDWLDHNSKETSGLTLEMDIPPLDHIILYSDSLQIDEVWVFSIYFFANKQRWFPKSNLGSNCLFRVCYIVASYHLIVS